MSIDREQLAWAAGLWDGEGSITYSPPKMYFHKAHDKFYPCKYITASIGQSGERQPDVLTRFLGIVSLGNITGPQQKRNAVLPVWRWQVGGYEKVQAVVAMLWVFLSEPKRHQAQRCLEGYRESWLAS